MKRVVNELCLQVKEKEKLEKENSDLLIKINKHSVNFKIKYVLF